MGSIASTEASSNSKSKTFNFFADNFGSEKSFVYVSDFGDKVLFTYNPDDVGISYMKIMAELLIKSDESDLVTFRSSECACSYDNNLDKLSKLSFKIRYDSEGFFHKKFSSDGKLKQIINDLEEFLASDFQ